MANEKKVEKTERDLRWEAFLAVYEKANPTKFAIRKAAGELDVIPHSFV